MQCLWSQFLLTTYTSVYVCIKQYQIIKRHNIYGSLTICISVLCAKCMLLVCCTSSGMLHRRMVYHCTTSWKTYLMSPPSPPPLALPLPTIAHFRNAHHCHNTLDKCLLVTATADLRGTCLIFAREDWRGVCSLLPSQVLLVASSKKCGEDAHYCHCWLEKFSVITAIAGFAFT